MGSAAFGAMRDLTKDITGLGIKSALGMTIDPGRSFANIGIGATLDMAGAASARAMGVTSSSYSAIGQSIATTLGSIFGGPAGAMAGALLGGWVGDRIGDALNDRDHEAQRDSLESGTMTRAEFDSRTSSAQTQAPGRQSVLDGFLDDMSRFGSDIADMTGITDARAAIDRAIDNARRDVTDALGITGDSDGGRDNGNDTGHDGSGARGEGNEGNSSPGGIGGYAQGGVVDSLYVPQGDDGFAALSFGEGVVS